MSTLIEQVALISESKRIKSADLMRVSAALQKQAMRDLRPAWGISATVDALERLEDMPVGYWPIVIMDDIGYDAAGIHLDRDGQPYALVSASNDIDVWSLTASHELVEMLVDPSGNRMVAGDSPKPEQDRVMFLVEVADPSEDARFAYTCNGVLVSDFYFPSYFDPVAATGVRYSYTGAITEPRQVLEGGYLSWHDPQSNQWWQRTWFDGPEPVFKDLGTMARAQESIRSQLDRVTAAETAKALGAGRKTALLAGLPSKVASAASTSRAAALREDFAEVLGRPRQGAPAGASGGVRRPPRRRIGD
jgi:hypothetical protein